MDQLTQPVVDILGTAAIAFFIVLLSITLPSLLVRQIRWFFFGSSEDD